MDAIGEGSFDRIFDRVPWLNVRHADARATVAAAVAPEGGLAEEDIAQALGNLYGKLKDHGRAGVSQQICISYGEQNVAQAVAAMSVLLFARRLFCRLDAVYLNEAGLREETVSCLDDLPI